MLPSGAGGNEARATGGTVTGRVPQQMDPLI